MYSYIKMRTHLLAQGKSIPSVNIPSNGPPSTPNSTYANWKKT